MQPFSNTIYAEGVAADAGKGRQTLVGHLETYETLSLPEQAHVEAEYLKLEEPSFVRAFLNARHSPTVRVFITWKDIALDLIATRSVHELAEEWKECPEEHLRGDLAEDTIVAALQRALPEEGYDPFHSEVLGGKYLSRTLTEAEKVR